MSEQLPVTVTRLKKKALAAIGIFVIVILTGGYFALRNTTVFVDATTHQPERYTELYFSSPTDLPVNVQHGTSLPVSFTAHNVEARDMSYASNVSLVSTSGKILTQKQQSFNLPSGQAKASTVSLVIPSDFRGRALVQVTLKNLNDQSIHFWVRVI